MKRFFLPKNYLSFILIVLMLFACNFSFAQTSCGWKSGDIVTFDQGAWGGDPAYTNSPPALLVSGFPNVYGNRFEIGIPGSSGFSLVYTSASFLLGYLPQLTGTPAALNDDLGNATTSSSGPFGGEVAALKLNIDFNDRDLTGSVSSTKFGDLVLYNLSNSSLNGLTIREFSILVNNALGGASTVFEISDLSNLAALINDAFLGGGPSQFAQLHLKKGWKQGDMLVYPQGNWGDANDPAATLLTNNFDNVYASTLGALYVGTGFKITFSSAAKVISYLPASGIASTLTSNIADPSTTPAGIFGGEVVALRLNVDYSDANLLSGQMHFGDLVLYDLDQASLNGMTVRGLLAFSEAILGGSNSSISTTTLSPIIFSINASFFMGQPSTWAQLHLKKGWKQGDMFTRTQVGWDQLPITFYDDYNDVYASTSGIMEVGIPGASGFSLRFTAGDNVQSFLIQTGTPAALDADAIDPTSSSSKQFGGEVTALRLNIDFADANKFAAPTVLPFGDLLLHDLTVSALNGKSVREVIAIANILLGGGSSTGVTISQINTIIAELNTAFLDGTPSLFAQLHLISLCEAANSNHCPVATAASVTTKIGSAINIQLQATDEDNNALSYSISQNASHGTVNTSASGAATYTPTAGYYGADEFKFKANDGNCDGEATVDISIVVCPIKKGDWKNDPGAWPVSSLTLGAQTYTKTELLNILAMPVGSGPKADASLILADQLIAAKLSIANGTVGGSIATTIAHAEALFSVFSGKLPYKVKPNTAQGKAMTTDASALENFNGGSQTTGCTASQPAARLATIMETAPIDFILEQNQPNPFYNTSVIRYHLPVNGANYRVTLKLYDVLGREIKTLVDETQGAGIKTISFNAASLSGGVYYYRLTAGQFAAVRKMILVK